MIEKLLTRPDIAQLVYDLEGIRKKILRLRWIYLSIFTLGVIPIFFFAPLAILTILMALTVMLIIAVLNIKTAKSYKERFKKELLPKLLAETNPTFRYEPTYAISKDSIARASFFINLDRNYLCEDLIRGNIDKTGLVFAEIRAQKLSGTIFRGIVFIADFNKNFVGHTFIKPKNWSGKMSKYQLGDVQKVTLEDAYFNNNFVTYASDQIEARYILTPFMMEKIGMLNKRSLDPISVTFINSFMYIALPLEKNYFEAPIKKSLLNPATFAQDLGILAFVSSIITEMDLNTRIWGKA